MPRRYQKFRTLLYVQRRHPFMESKQKAIGLRNEDISIALCEVSMLKYPFRSLFRQLPFPQVTTFSVLGMVPGD